MKKFGTDRLDLLKTVVEPGKGTPKFHHYKLQKSLPKPMNYPTYSRPILAGYDYDGKKFPTSKLPITCKSAHILFPLSNLRDKVSAKKEGTIVRKLIRDGGGDHLPRTDRQIQVVSQEKSKDLEPIERYEERHFQIDRIIRYLSAP